jgi:hypothetical protein
VFTKNKLSDSRWKQEPDQPIYYKARVRGSRWNNVWVVGSSLKMSHYNGSTWRHFTTEFAAAGGYLLGVAVTPKKIIAVGFIGVKAVVIQGTMQ